jgi:hypothetical protein
MVERRGTIYIAPVASYVPSGWMVDPEASTFSVSWEDWDKDTQTGELLEHGGEVAGAEAAIAWGRERSDEVLIRLGHTEATYFSAGHVHLTDRVDGTGRALPVWPRRRGFGRAPHRTGALAHVLAEIWLNQAGAGAEHRRTRRRTLPRSCRARERVELKTPPEMPSPSLRLGTRNVRGLSVRVARHTVT